MAALDGVAKRVHQSPVFVVVEAPLTSGEDQDLGARVSEDEKFHVAAQAVAKPFVILALHLLSDYEMFVPE